MSFLPSSDSQFEPQRRVELFALFVLSSDRDPPFTFRLPSPLLDHFSSFSPSLSSLFGLKKVIPRICFSIVGCWKRSLPITRLPLIIQFAHLFPFLWLDRPFSQGCFVFFGFFRYAVGQLPDAGLFNKLSFVNVPDAFFESNAWSHAICNRIESMMQELTSGLSCIFLAVYSSGPRFPPADRLRSPDATLKASLPRPNSTHRIVSPCVSFLLTDSGVPQIAVFRSVRQSSRSLPLFSALAKRAYYSP